MSIGNHNVYAPRMGGRRPTTLECGEKPTEKKGPLFIAALAFAQFALFVALLGPVMVSMALKAGTIAKDPTELTSIVGNVLSIGAIAAVIGNALFGRLSDRTMSRFGRRRPWIIGGSLVMAASLWLISAAPDATLMTVGWFLAQLGANACFSPFIATLFTDNMTLLFLVPAVVGVVGMVVYALILPDPVLKVRPPRLDLLEVLKSFWVNPFRHRDFGLAWWSRFLIILASFMFTTFRLPFIVNRLGIDEKAGASTVFLGVLIYTGVLVASGYLAGWFSDRTGYRKLPVCVATALFALGTYLLFHVDSVGQFYLVEALLGFAYGIYMSVDMALVLQVLPNPEDNGKDLGVFNMANAIPQSLAPYLGGVLLATGATAAEPNFGLLLGAAAIVCLVGAFVILPIKKVK